MDRTITFPLTHMPSWHAREEFTFTRYEILTAMWMKMKQNCPV